MILGRRGGGRGLRGCEHPDPETGDSKPTNHQSVRDLIYRRHSHRGFQFKLYSVAGDTDKTCMTESETE